MAFQFFKNSSNPVLKDSILENTSHLASLGATMTTQGAVRSSLLGGLLLLAGAAIGWYYPSNLFLWPAAIAGLVLVLIASFKKEWSPIIVPIYAVVEGLFVGTISLLYASAFQGIIFHAVSLTLASFFLMLFLYQSRIIRVTERFKSVIIIATASIFFMYLISFVLSFFHISVPMIHDTGILGIGVSLFVVIIASLNLLLDFDFFEKGQDAGLPKYMEWFAAMGLLVTIVWLYLEMLRLLSKISSRD
ncbi:MAG TPA: Bax inhibitor-1/YccA family protein [Saprospiraceae bacterium]|nr:Bax inhibitor-1/YccA family protein [Saprospiraceae bacterium]